jgi:hypothetical protein
LGTQECRYCIGYLLSRQIIGVQVKVAVRPCVRQTLTLRIKACPCPVTAALSVSYRSQPSIQEDKNIGLGELLPELWR